MAWGHRGGPAQRQAASPGVARSLRYKRSLRYLSCLICMKIMGRDLGETSLARSGLARRPNTSSGKKVLATHARERAHAREWHNRASRSKCSDDRPRRLE